jgi:uncharacterized protein (TIGR00255 family)
MTGFGRGEGETTLGKVFVETRSVNHRYCDINIKLPKRLTAFENRIKEIIRAQVSRGRIDIFLKLDNLGEENVHLSVDLHLAEQYYRALQSLKESLHLKDKITLELVAGAKDVISAKEETGDLEPFWQEVLPILKRSFQDLDDMKRLEGETSSSDWKESFSSWGRSNISFLHGSRPIEIDSMKGSGPFWGGSMWTLPVSNKRSPCWPNGRILPKRSSGQRAILPNSSPY